MLCDKIPHCFCVFDHRSYFLRAKVAQVYGLWDEFQASSSLPKIMPELIENLAFASGRISLTEEGISIIQILGLTPSERSCVDSDCIGHTLVR